MGNALAHLRGAIAEGGRPAEDVTTDAYLRSCGLSERTVERFLRPFFGGVFLERALETPLAKFAFVFSMFARGPAALPGGTRSARRPRHVPITRRSILYRLLPRRVIACRWKFAVLALRLGGRKNAKKNLSRSELI